MPSSETPDQNTESIRSEKRPEENPSEAQSPVVATGAEAVRPAIGGYSSRWVQYETHELLEMINTLEDERRWARLREGVLWALLAHLALVLALILVPKYVFKAPPVVERGLHDKDEFTYLDSPAWRPKTPPKPAPPIKSPQIDKQTLDEIRKQAPPAPVEKPQPQPAQPQVQAPPAQQAQVTPPVQPQPQGQSEAPRPAASPKPNFAMGAQNPMSALRDAMRGAAKNRGMSGGGGFSGGGSGLRMHPGAGGGGVEVLSDTQGVDFSSWLHAWHYETEKTWDPLIPDEVNAPIYKSGVVAIRFKVLPNGRLMPGSLVLEGRSGDVALDRAAWGALTGSNYPQLPHDFHGPYLELRAFFLYNMRQR